MRVGDQLGDQQLGRDQELAKFVRTEDQPQGAACDADGKGVVGRLMLYSQSPSLFMRPPP